MKTSKNSNLLIYVIAFVALLPALALRDFTPDNELRYLSIADEALRNGSIFCFTNHGALYADKPPLYLWIVMLGKRLFGMNCMWFVGLFSLLPMLATGWIMNRWTVEHITAPQRRTALLMLFTCGYMPLLALTLRMDMMMTMWIVAALYTAWRCVDVPSRWHSALLGLLTFLALFTKGPLGLIIPILGSAVYLVWTRRGRLFFRIWSWPAWAVLLGGCALWFGGVYAEGGDAYLNNLLFHQTVDRAVDAFHHKRPFWYYAIAVWYVLAPWSILYAVLAWKRKGQVLWGSFRKLCLSVAGVTFVVLSLISSKLQVYLLPMIPFVVYWGASLIKWPACHKWVRGIAYGLLALFFVAGAAMPFVNHMIGYGTVCREVSEKNPTAVYVSSDVRRGENIDAYFNVPVRVVAPDSIPTSEPGAVVILKGEGKNKLSYKTL